MKAILTLLMLALAAVAIPSGSAAVAPPCHVNQSNDTVCHAEAAGCEVDTYAYDVEDALNQYTVDCWGCGVHVGGGGLVDCPIVAVAEPVPAGGFAASAAAVAPPALPCQTGIAGTDCAVGAASCVARAGYRTGSSSYEYAAVYCGPPTWSPCEHVYVDTTGQVRSCHAATASAQAAQPCQSGLGASWCTVNAGSCTLTLVTFTAWGDRWAEADCRGGSMTRCHAEVHTDDPANPEQWCAF